MVDIVPSLLKNIEDDFSKNFKDNQIIRNLYELLNEGSATYADAHKFSIEVGNLLSNSFKKYISIDVLPDGKMHYNIVERILNKTLRNNHTLISDVCVVVQKKINTDYGIGLKPIKSPYKTDAVNDLIDKVSDAELFDEIRWVLDEPIKTFSEKIVDDTIKANAEFQSSAGLSPKIVRISTGDCCEWCEEIAGEYIYPDNVPDDVYRRHNRCRCITEFVSVAKTQNVWTKK